MDLIDINTQIEELDIALANSEATQQQKFTALKIKNQLEFLKREQLIKTRLRLVTVDGVRVDE